jgi:hypothetical protein
MHGAPKKARANEPRIEIETPAILTEQHRDGVKNAAHHCLFHNTLLHPPKIVVEVAHPEPTAL